MANYLLDIVILLAAAVVAVPVFRAAGLGAVPGFLDDGDVAKADELILGFRDTHSARMRAKKSNQ